jgi:uncharacterized protein YndB with AHSA1/START domain
MQHVQSLASLSGAMTMKARFLAAVTFFLACGESWAQTSDPLVHEGIVPASIESVWASWTTTDGLTSWLAPHAEIDFRIGGKMRTNYYADGDLDDPRTIENTILSYDPYKMISIRVSKAPKDFPFPNAVYDTWTVLYFESVRPDETLVRVVSNGFSADEESQRMRTFFDQGNAATVRQMQDRIGVGRR